MRGKGINYDTGFSPGGEISRPEFDPEIVRREMRVIASELRCTAVRITGGEPGRLSIAAERAAAEGLEVWFSPFPCELPTEQLAPLLADCADRAEHLRRSGARVVLVTGAELTLFAAGFFPGGDFFERVRLLQSPSQDHYAAFAAMPAKLNGLLAETAAAARERFSGPVSYAAAPWEPVDWRPFDIASADAYRAAANAGGFRAELRKHLGHGKPLAVTEFGCCCYAGAADRGGMGWAIIDESADPPRLDGDYIRDEAEQVRYLADLHAIFAEEGVDLAFWFTFAGYNLPHRAEPRQDLDLISYGLVTMLEAGPPAGYQGLGWQPRLAFGALAKLGQGPDG
jgi:hypothetical protein